VQASFAAIGPHLQDVLQQVTSVNINLTKTSAVPTESMLGGTGGA
jgi:hypothetical protein